MVLGLSELSHILALSLRVNGNAFNFNKSMSIVPSLKVMHTSSKSLIHGCMDFHSPYHEMWEAGALGRVSLLHPQQEV